MGKIVETIELLSPSPGTSRTIAVHHYGTPGKGPKAYFQGAIHADEYPGLLVANHLVALLDQAEQDGLITGEVVVVPVANPIGLDQCLNGSHRGRYELCSGGNFNRDWPDLSDAVAGKVRGHLGKDEASNVKAIRKALTQAVAELPENNEFDSLRKALLGQSVTADFVFDLHCDLEALMHLYASRRHRDLAVELGRDIDARVVLLENEPGGAPFDEANAGVWWRLRDKIGAKCPFPDACFATTVELRGVLDVEDSLAALDARGMYRFLQRHGLIKGPGEPVPDTPLQPTPLEGTDVLSSPGAGIVVYHKQIGDQVRAGDVVAELIDLMEPDPKKARTPIVSKATGLFFARMTERLMRPGAEIGKIAGPEPLAHRKAGQLLSR